MKRNWFDIKVLILGFSKSGISAAKYLATKGADCFITEKECETPEDKALADELKRLEIRVEFGGHSKEFLEGAHIAVTSPSIPPDSEIMEILKEKKIPVMSEIELAYMETTVPFIAITGTNGKTTTTALTSHILSTKYKAPACGNIGVPPTSLLGERSDYLVTELSSYQLEYSPSFKPQIAAFMTFTPDHITWHKTLENYYRAKAKIFLPPLAPAYAIFSAKYDKLIELSKKCPSEVFYIGKEFTKNCCYVKDNQIFFKWRKDCKIMDVKDVPLVGEHNLENVMAAIVMAEIVGLTGEEIKEGIKSFKPVPHRCEFVGSVGNIYFYNDSKATNPEAAIVAIESFVGKTVTLIAGGRDKLTSLEDFCKSVNSRIKDVILIGEATERFETELVKSGYQAIHKEMTLEGAVDLSIELKNDICLFSPACASFDMFDNYEARGDIFKQYVHTKK